MWGGSLTDSGRASCGLFDFLVASCSCIRLYNSSFFCSHASFFFSALSLTSSCWRSLTLSRSFSLSLSFSSMRQWSWGGDVSALCRLRLTHLKLLLCVVAFVIRVLLFLACSASFLSRHSGWWILAVVRLPLLSRLACVALFLVGRHDVVNNIIQLNVGWHTYRLLLT